MMARRVLAATVLAVFLSLTVTSVASAHDCSSPADCEQTAGYNGALAVAGAAIALGAAVLGSQLGASAGAAASEAGAPAPEAGEEPVEGEPPPVTPGYTRIISGQEASQILIEGGAQTVTIDGKTYIIPPETWPPGVQSGTWTTTPVVDPSTGRTINVIPPEAPTIVVSRPPAAVPAPPAPPVEATAPPETPVAPAEAPPGEPQLPVEEAVPPPATPRPGAPPILEGERRPVTPVPGEPSPWQAIPPAEPEVVAPEAVEPEAGEAVSEPATPVTEEPAAMPPRPGAPPILEGEPRPAPPPTTEPSGWRAIPPSEAVTPEAEAAAETEAPATPAAEAAAEAAPEVAAPAAEVPQGPAEAPEAPPAEEPEAEPAPAAEAAPVAAGVPQSFDDAAEGRVSSESPPETIELPEEVTSALRDSWNQSATDPASREHGATLVKRGGAYVPTNTHFGDDGSFRPDYTTHEGEAAKGAFHTHPFGEGEAAVSFSSGDFNHFIWAGDNIHGVQTGETQFVMVRTEKTPARVDYDEVNRMWDEANFEAQQQGLGATEASKRAAIKVADALGIKIYQGEGGRLTLQN